MRTSIHIAVHSDLTAFGYNTIGTKVRKPGVFFKALTTAIENHDTGNDRAPGKHFIVLPLELVESAEVMAGVGKRTQNPDDFVLRCYRKRVGVYLRQEHALPVSFLACIVHTLEAYLKDPDVVEAGITGWDLHAEATHVIVAVLANSEGVDATARTPFRLCSNIAGGDNEAEMWSLEDTREVCRSSAEFALDFCVVADDPE